MGKIYNQQRMINVRRKLRNSMPKAEVYLWTYLKGKKISGHKFRRQFSVNNYILDFYCPALKLAIEVDGQSHHFKNNIKNGKLRQDRIVSLGINFLRFTNEEIYGDIESVLKRIKDYIEHEKDLPYIPSLARRRLKK